MVTAMEEQQNRRKYFRLELNKALCGNVEIVQIKGKSIHTKITKVCIEDIGPGGLRFVSDLKLPVTNEIVLEIEIKLLDEYVKLLGIIVRRKDLSENLFEYGVQFTIFDHMQNMLTQSINKLTIRLRTRPNLSSCAFCSMPDNEKCFGSHGEPPGTQR